MEQRYQAVLEVVNDGASVTDVARRYGVAPDAARLVAALRGRWAAGVGGSNVEAVVVPASDGELEARVVELRRQHPGWGPRTIVYCLERGGVAALPGARRSSGA